MRGAAELPSGIAAGGPGWLSELIAPLRRKLRRFDEVDRRLLALLVRDGRARPETIGRVLGLRSGRSIRARLRSLEQEGIIQGYTARVDERYLGVHVVAFVTVGFKPPDQQAVAALRETLRSAPEIRESYVVAGSGDLLLKVCADSTETLHRLVLERLGCLRGVNSLRTTLVVGEVREPVPD